MATKISKQLIGQLGDLGFDHIWTNTQGFPCFVHPDDPEQTEISVNPSMHNERIARKILHGCKKIAGVAPTTEKRKGGKVKERRAAARDHAAEVERAQARLRWVEGKRTLLEATVGADPEHLRRVNELVEVRRQELLALHRQMTESPQGGQHLGRGRVEHVATSRTPI